MKSLIVAILVIVVSIGQLVLARRSSSSFSEWTLYKNHYGKVYKTPEEDAHRFSLFLDAKNKIERHNQMNDSSFTYKLGLSHLSDRFPDELDKRKGFRYGASSLKQSAEADEYLRKLMNDPKPTPNELDWRKFPNRVTSVKDQLECESSWAFAAVGVLEGQQVTRNFTTKLLDLSAQDLIDCSTSYNEQCFGGMSSYAFEDIADIRGINSANYYPYTGTYDWIAGCRYSPSRAIMFDSGAMSFTDGESALEKLVANFGPVAVGVAVGIASEQWSFYKSGVYDNPACGNILKHEVLVVGYGSDPRLGDFWIIKNSWSPNWGEEGYIRLRRGTRMCGIGDHSTIAKFDYEDDRRGKG